MVHVNILQKVKEASGWKNRSLPRDKRGRIKWPSGRSLLIEWREDGRRQRQAAGTTSSEALEAQRRKRFELEAKARGLKIEEPVETDTAISLKKAIEDFIKDIQTFRKPMTTQIRIHSGLVREAHCAEVGCENDHCWRYQGVSRLAQIERTRSGHNALYRPGDPAQFFQSLQFP